MKKYRQSIVIEYELEDNDNPPNEADIECALGGDVHYTHTQKTNDRGGFDCDDAGNFKVCMQ